MALTQKQEKFAQLWHELGNKSEAYRQAYDCSTMSDKSINDEASKLSGNPEITQRFLELQQAALEQHSVTIDSLTEKLNKAYEVGNERKSASGMVQAVMGLAKIHGMVTDKAEIHHSGSVEVRIINMAFDDGAPGSD